MTRQDEKAKRNVEHARRWLDRAIKDLALFKKLVPFDKRSNKLVRCSDPALAIYLLQQSVEKAVKSAAIASGQYKPRDFRSYFRHNSLALIIDLNTKIVTQLQAIGLGSVATMMGIDLVDGGSKLAALENQIMGVAPLLDKNGRKVDFRTESIRIPLEIINQILDMVIQHRKLLLDAIRTAFNILPTMGIRKDYDMVDNPQEFLKRFADSVTANLRVRPLSEEQLKVPLEFIKLTSDLGFSPADELKRRDTITNYLGVWAFSNALLFLSYLTFAHEDTTRYPLRRKGDIEMGKIGCDDYDDSLGIVTRIARVGYATSLTLNDMRKEIDNLTLFFAVTKHQ
jgi:hypothetical protein